MICFERKRRKGHSQSDEYWNCFKGNVEETSETEWSTKLSAFPSAQIPS